MKGGRSTKPLHPLEVTSAKEEELTTIQGAATTIAVCLPLCDQKHQSVIEQIPNIWRRWSFFSHKSSHRLCKLLQETYTAACHWAGSWVVVSELKSTEINCNYYPGFPWKLSASLFQNSKIVLLDTFCQCNCYLGGETDS